MSHTTTFPSVSIKRVEADGCRSVSIARRGAPDAPVVLLLHGFPSSVAHVSPPEPATGGSLPA